MPLIGLGTGVNHLTRLLNALPLPNTITITGEPDAGTLTTATAGQTHAELLALINEGTATTDGPGSVSITATLLGDSTDPVQGGQSITGVYLLYTATEAPSVPRNIVFDPVITVPVPDTTAPTFVSAATDSSGLVWGLTFDEAVYGTGDPANWTATADGVGLTIDTVSITDTTAVEIILTGTAPVNGEALLISYSGGDLADLAGIPVADITPQTVANNVPVAEPFTLTTVGGEAEVNAEGFVTYTFTAPSIYANYDAGEGPGVFSFGTSTTEVRPLNLVPPRVISDPDPVANDVWTLLPGLWAYDPALGDAVLSVTTNGVGTLVNNGNDYSYTVAAGDEGNSVFFIEQLDQDAVTRVRQTVPIAVPVVGGADVWVVSGSVITNVPATSTWAVTGSTIDTVGAN